MEGEEEAAVPTRSLGKEMGRCGTSALLLAFLCVGERGGLEEWRNREEATDRVVTVEYNSCAVGGGEGEGGDGEWLDPLPHPCTEDGE